MMHETMSRKTARLARWTVAGILILLASGGLPARAQGGWSTPVNLSESDTASYYPDLAVDSAGHVYVVWGEYRDETADHWPDYLMFRMWDGRIWSPKNDIKLGGHLPQIGVDSQGRLHTTSSSPVFEWVTEYQQAWAQERPVGAAAWSKAQPLGLVSPYWPDMNVDSQDRVHFVFTDLDPAKTDLNRREDGRGVCQARCSGVFYTHSTDGGRTWSSGVELDLPDVDANSPRVMSDRLRNVYAVWVDVDASTSGRGFGISFNTSADGGETWRGAAQIAAGKSEQFGNPQIAVDFRGVIHVVWRNFGDDSVGLGYIRSSDGGQSWSPVEVLPLPVSGSYSFGLVADAANMLHVVLPLEGGAYPAGVYHLSRPAGGGWSSPAPVSRNPCNAGSSDVELAVSQGNRLHAAWYDRQECELGWVEPSGRGEVYYSQLITAAPAAALAPLPPAPTAESELAATQRATPLTAPTPTATPSPEFPRRVTGRSSGSLGVVLPGIGLSALALGVAAVVHRSRTGRHR